MAVNTTTPYPPTLIALRILYAEDVQALREVARISLTRLGHHIQCVEDGRAALAAVTVDPQAFDLIITDHHMPGMNGLEFVKALRQLPFAGKLIIFCSELSPGVAESYEQLGADRILYKPILPSTLREVIGELFSVPTTTIQPWPPPGGEPPTAPRPHTHGPE